MLGPTISDGTVTLRPPEAKDIQDRFASGFHAEIVEMYGGNPEAVQEMTIELAEEWYSFMCQAPRFRTWVIAMKDRCVGHCFLDEFEENHRRCRLSLGLFSPDDFNKGIGTRSVKLALSHAFGGLGVHRVELLVLEKNTGAIRCYEKAGFKWEATLRDNVLLCGRFENDVIMSILEDEFTR